MAVNVFLFALCFVAVSCTCNENNEDDFELHGQPDRSEAFYEAIEKEILAKSLQNNETTRVAKRDVMLWVSYSVPNDTVWNELLDNIRQHSDSLTRVCINGYGVMEDGTFGDADPAYNNSQYAKKYAPVIRAMGLPVTIMVTGSKNTTYLLNMLENDTLRESFLDTAMSEANIHGYDGYNIDVEQQCNVAQRAIYIDFIKEWARRLHEVNKTLTLDMGGFCAWADYMNLTCDVMKTMDFDQIFSMDTYTSDIDKYTRYIKTAMPVLGNLYAAGMERNQLLTKPTMDLLIANNVTGIGIFRNPPSIEAFWDTMSYFKYH